METLQISAITSHFPATSSRDGRLWGEHWVSQSHAGGLQHPQHRAPGRWGAQPSSRQGEKSSSAVLRAPLPPLHLPSTRCPREGANTPLQFQGSIQ